MRRALFPALIALLAAGGCHRQAPRPPQAEPSYTPTPKPGALPNPVEAVTINAGKHAPDTPIEGPDGRTVKIADFKGRPVLLNLWATWCAPCVRELPTLDALAARTAGRLEVLTVSQDMQGRKVVDAFFQAHRYPALKAWLDKDNGLMLDLKEASLPVSILYDADGKEVWRVQRDLDWSGARAKQLLAQGGVG